MENIECPKLSVVHTAVKTIALAITPFQIQGRWQQRLGRPSEENWRPKEHKQHNDGCPVPRASFNWATRRRKNSSLAPNPFPGLFK
jgi:hypothetical protein